MNWEDLTRDQRRTARMIGFSDSPAAAEEYVRQLGQQQLEQQAVDEARKLREQILAQQSGGVSQQQAASVGNIPVGNAQPAQAPAPAPSPKAALARPTPRLAAPIDTAAGAAQYRDVLGSRGQQQAATPPPTAPAPSLSQLGAVRAPSTDNWRAQLIRPEFAKSPTWNAFAGQMTDLMQGQEAKQKADKEKTALQGAIEAMQEKQPDAANAAKFLLDAGDLQSAKTVIQKWGTADLAPIGQKSVAQLQQEFNTPENRANLSKRLDEMKSSGLYNDEVIANLRPLVDTNPFALNERLANMGVSLGNTLASKKAGMPLDVQAEAAKTTARMSVEQNAPQTKWAQEDKLAGDFQQQTKDWETVSNQYGRMQNALAAIEKNRAEGKPVGTLQRAVVASYLNVVAPNARINSANIDTFGDTGGALDQAKEWIKRVWSGEQLGPEEMAQMAQLAQQAYTSEKSIYDAASSNYSSIASQRGLNVQNVVGRSGSGEQVKKPRKRYNPKTGAFEVVQ